MLTIFRGTENDYGPFDLYTRNPQLRHLIYLFNLFTGLEPNIIYNDVIGYKWILRISNFTDSYFVNKIIKLE